MEKIDSLKIPKSHAEFAKEIADLADKHDMNGLIVTYSPKLVWPPDEDKPELDRRVRGEMKILYSSTDGRGRPSRHLSINCEANFSLDIYDEPTSY